MKKCCTNHKIEMNMYFKRTLYPVGQGAFFSEQFGDTNDRVWFNVVYDCGSFSQELLHKEIDGMNQKINIMFISHFDNDHINGLKYLIENGYLIKGESTVIIPFLYPNLIKILLPEMKNQFSSDGTKANEAYESLKTLFDSGIKIIGLEDNWFNRDGNIFGGLVSIKDLLKTYDDIKTIKNFSLLRVPQDKNNVHETTCWYYMPFNPISDGNRKEKFIEELKKELKEYSKGKCESKFNEYQLKLISSLDDYLQNISSSFNAFDLINEQDFIDLLKKLYKKASSGIDCVTAINVNSMNLLSFSAKELKSESSGNLNYNLNQYELMRNNSHGIFIKKKENKLESQYQDFMFNHVGLLKEYETRFSKFSCLYTGDCVMEDHFFSWFDLIVDVIDEPLFLLQIPHHGSKNNYHKKILMKPVKSVFINFNSNYTNNKHVKSIEEDFMNISKPCFEITQNRESRFEQFVYWDSSLKFLDKYRLRRR